MTDKLTEKERVLLLYCVRKHAPNLLNQLPVLDSGKQEDDLVNEIREAVGSEIAVKGFLKNDKESYEYGMELEALIDRLADLYLWPEEKKR
jgi:hypothetical protein